MALARTTGFALRIVSTARTTGVQMAYKSTAALDADHKEWLDSVQTRPVNTDPHMEFTLEWMLPTPVPMHVFDQPPIVVEVKNRNPDFVEMH